MFREDNGQDVTDDEFEDFIEPFYWKCHKHLHENILPEYVAFYIG